MPAGTGARVTPPQDRQCPAYRSHPGHHRADRWQIDLVVSAVPRLIVFGQPRPAMRTAKRLGEHRLIRVGSQQPSATVTAQAALPSAAASGLAALVGLLTFGGWQARIVRRLGWLPQLCLQLRNASFGRSQPLEQRLDQRVLLGMAQLAEIEVRGHLDVESSRP